ncbi:MAG: pilus assembly protein TadG-related protein [Thermoleophilia bacterium]
MARDETGAIAVLVAILMVVFLGLAALVVDAGGLYDHDREIQTAADAGALAGAQEIIRQNGLAGVAAPMAGQYVTKNVDESSVDEDNLTVGIDTDDKTFVEVTLREEKIPLFFARALGHETGAVNARARAETKYLTGVESAFPVALMYANPHHWRFVFKSGGEEKARFDLYDSATGGDITQGDGVFDEVQDRSPNPWTPSAGTYDVYLYAMDKDNNDALELGGPIGLFYVPAAESRLRRVGMERVDGNSVAVYAEVGGEDTVVEAMFGSDNKYTTMSKVSEGLYRATLYPSPKTGNDGWGTTDLSIRVQQPADDDKKGGGKPKWDEFPSVARYIGFHPDVPILDLMMTTTLDGYSALPGTAATPGARIKVRILKMGDEYVLKLSSKDGSNYLAGNWRWADIWADYSLKREIEMIADDLPFSGLLTTEKKDPGEMGKGLYIGGPLWPETGNKIGALKPEVLNKLVGKVVTVPIVDYAPNLTGGSEHYTISGFAAFWITEYSGNGPDKGELRGRFDRWLATGRWQDTPPGPLYVETAVLTE